MQCLSISPGNLPTSSFHLLWTKKVFRKVIGTEGPVLEPLECDHQWIVWVSEPIEGGSVFLLPDRGGSLKRLHRPNPLGLDCMGFKEDQSFKIFMSINPDCPERGPYEASEGIYHGRATKTGGGQGYSALATAFFPSRRRNKKKF
jgi:hypothetical protein